MSLIVGTRFINAASIFHAFEGHWKLERTISHFGKINGKARFDRISPNMYAYNEEGILVTHKGEEIKVYRDYVYEYLDEKISVFFKGKEKNLLHTLHFEEGYKIATARHVCACDTYDAVYEFTNLAEFKLTYCVKGPQKNFIIATNFRKKN